MLSKRLNRYLLVTVPALLISAPAVAQFNWAVSAGDLGDEVGYGISVDADGYVYAAGSITGEPLFGTIRIESAGEVDAFLAKYGPDGQPIWVQRGGGIGVDVATDVAVGADGDVYVVGNFEDTAAFGDFEISRSGMGAFIAKYEGDGHVVWVRQPIEVGFSQGLSVATDPSGYICAAGRHSIYAFAAKYSPTGDSLWTWVSGDAPDFQGVAEASSITSDGKGGCLLAGHFDRAISLGTDTLRSDGNRDPFIVRIDSTGHASWSRQIGGFGDAYSTSIHRNGSDFVVAGGFALTADFGPMSVTSEGRDDMFLARYDSTGHPLWARQIGGYEQDRAVDAAVDENGNIYAFGNYFLSTTIGSTTHSSSGVDDLFIARYSSDGSLLSSASYGGSGREYGHAITASFDNTYVTGSFLGATRFAQIRLESKGGYDIFAARLRNLFVLSDHPVPTRFRVSPAWPSPTRGKVEIAFRGNAPQHVQVTVLDMLGRDAAVPVRFSPGDSSISIDATGMAAGTYVVRVSTDDQVESRTFTVMR